MLKSEKKTAQNYFEATPGLGGAFGFIGSTSLGGAAGLTGGAGFIGRTGAKNINMGGS